MTLSHFHPRVRRWFLERVGKPTEVQEQAWPRIVSGEHVLVTAPTGSGKTLTAFLWALERLITGTWERGRTRVLYVSPLKALNNDIRRNLIAPLMQLRRIFEEAAQPFPEIRALTRSGDTPQADRRRMVRHPPEILITTPESLNLLLSSQGGRSMLGHLASVILDEIHAVFGTKRGTHLITAVDRLVPLSGEFQRIALSATIRPLEEVAAFVGGFLLKGDAHDPTYVPRPVTILESPAKKAYQVQVRYPRAAGGLTPEETLWDLFAQDFKGLLRENRSTLIFTNSRRLCENLCRKINQGADPPLAYAHHGSLSREIRREVEKKLKAGDLKAIVATSSLELGIDIGTLDEVILVQCPPSISSAIQRVGRAGHWVGAVSKGTLYPSHGQDLLEAAVLAPAIPAGDLEKTHPVECPLDVLAQVLVSMACSETLKLDELFARIRTSYPFRNLSRDLFDRVLDMLGGRYGEGRIRALKPRLSIDRLDGTVGARKGAALALYTSGGVIPDRGYFQLRHQATRARIGELDEEFVWEATLGQTFTLGTQHWRIEKITHNDVLVSPGGHAGQDVPFWRAEARYRDFHFSRAIARFLEQADGKLDDPAFLQTLERDHHLSRRAGEALIAYLKDQRARTKSRLPHGRHLLVEFVKSAPGAAPGHQVVLHTFWGGRVNRPYAMALSAAWEERFGEAMEIYVGDDCMVLQLPRDLDARALLTLVTRDNVESHLRKRLETSGFFGARFRECAGRALLLNRKSLRQRLPLWMSRLRSKKLLDSVLGYDDFPILLEAWRTCLKDEFDLESLKKTMEQLFGYPARAELWESEILPSRIPAYDPAWMDRLVQEEGLLWVGSANQKIAFCLRPDLDLVLEDPGETLDLFPDPKGRYDFATLLELSKTRSSTLAERLWAAVWNSQVTNDTFLALRKGIENRFKATDASQTGRRRRTGFARWKGALPFAGNWYGLSGPDLPEDPIEEAELKKDRVRVLLDRYGILFRELLEGELPPFRWSAVFRTLRLMELSGEVLTGCFFHGIPGPQFITHKAFRLLQQGLPHDVVYWLNAADPASVCGMSLEGLKGRLPKRLPGTHLVYGGDALLLESRKMGRVLDFRLPPDDPGLKPCLAVLRHLLTRRFQPLRQIKLESINGADPAQSPYLDALQESFEVMKDYRDVILYARL